MCRCMHARVEAFAKTTSLAHGWWPYLPTCVRLMFENKTSSLREDIRDEFIARWKTTRTRHRINEAKNESHDQNRRTICAPCFHHVQRIQNQRSEACRCSSRGRLHKGLHFGDLFVRVRREILEDLFLCQSNLALHAVSLVCMNVSVLLSVETAVM
jgi:hypothetical protein